MHKFAYALFSAPVRNIPDGERGGSGADDPGAADDTPEGDEPEGDQPEGDEPEGDEPEGEDADHGDPGDEDQQPQQSRGSRRIQEQARINREIRERAEAAERRAADAEARAAAREDVERRAAEQREAAEEREALASMSEEQKAVYQLAKGHRKLDQQLAALGTQSRDADDRAAFSDYINSDEGKRFSKYRGEVDQLVRQARAAGQFVSREIVLNQLIARDVRNGKSVDTQRAAAKKRVDNARGRTTSQRSDAGGGGNKKLNHVQRMEKADIAI